MGRERNCRHTGKWISGDSDKQTSDRKPALFELRLPIRLSIIKLLSQLEKSQRLVISDFKLRRNKNRPHNEVCFYFVYKEKNVLSMQREDGKEGVEHSLINM